MRIAHVANFYGPRSGGLRTTMHELARGYRAAGHEVALVVPGARTDDEVTAYGRRITVRAPVVPGTGGYRMIVDVGDVRRILDGLRPDVLEVSDRTTLGGLGGWAAERRIASVVFAHERVDRILGQFLLATAPWAAVADRLNARVGRRFGAVVATTEFAATEWVRVGAANLVRIPLGVDLETFHPRRRDEALRRRLLGDAKVLLVQVARLSPEKQPWVGVETLRQLRGRHVDAALVLAGAGPKEQFLRRSAGACRCVSSGTCPLAPTSPPFSPHPISRSSPHRTKRSDSGRWKHSPAARPASCRPNPLYLLSCPGPAQRRTSPPTSAWPRTCCSSETRTSCGATRAPSRRGPRGR